MARCLSDCWEEDDQFCLSLILGEESCLHGGGTISGCDSLSFTADSPSTKSRHQNLKSPRLDPSPFVYKRAVGYVGNPPHLLGSSPYRTPLDDVRLRHNHSNLENMKSPRQQCFGSPQSSTMSPPSAFKAWDEKSDKTRNEANSSSVSAVRCKRRLLDPPFYNPPLVKVESPPSMVQEGSGCPPTKGTPRENLLFETSQASFILDPNKGVLMLDATGKILTMNDIATLLLGESIANTDRMSLLDLLPNPADEAILREKIDGGGDGHPHHVVDPPLSRKSESGEGENEIDDFLFSGEVVNMKRDFEDDAPFSLWMKEFPAVHCHDETQWVAVIEPISTTVSKVTINKYGVILKADKNFHSIFGSEAVVDYDNLFCFVSALKLPSNVTEERINQRCTGTTKEGEQFPLSVTIMATRGEKCFEGTPVPLFDVRIELFSNISGLVIVDEIGTISKYNHTFTRLLFGYGPTELEGQNINKIIPDFQRISFSIYMNNNFFGPEVTSQNDSMKNGSSSFDANAPLHRVASFPLVSSDSSAKENNRYLPVESSALDKDSGGLSDPVIRKTSNITNGSNHSTNDRNANDDKSSSVDTPNKAFVISDSSQFTLSSGHFASSKNVSHISSATSLNPSSFNQTETGEATLESSIKGDYITPDHVMRDITNSMNVFSVNEYLDQTRFTPNQNLITSTPAPHHIKQGFTIQEGSFFTVGKHKDGSYFSVMYQIRYMFSGGRNQYCVWITWEPSDSVSNESKSHLKSSSTETPIDLSLGSVISKKAGPEMSAVNGTASSAIPEHPREGRSDHFSGQESDYEDEDDEDTSRSITHTNGSSCNDYSIGHSTAGATPAAKRRSLSENDACDRVRVGKKPSQTLTTTTVMLTGKPPTKEVKKIPVTRSSYEEPEWVLMSGEYGTRYSILRQIGKGAFGYVKLCSRNTDGLLVVTKYIKKSQVYKDSWTVDPTTGKKTCLEVEFLLKLDHPNIVKALECYENDKYFQLVMEKWGSGMDLFEFIDRKPALDEPLAAYIFRQILSSLKYLNDMNIIHRDIKDENIIINQKFHIKLIDFGSATYLKPDKKFTQFAGTIEYCSPEVLKGHRYSGLELEIWSLGITLYTLMAGANPFSTVEQVLEEDSLVIPRSFSNELFFLIRCMLQKDPKLRWTLKDVLEYPWTNQPIDIDLYSFKDILPCTSEELSPPQYLSDYGVTDDNLQSVTSNSFVYENRQSFTASEESSRYGEYKEGDTSVSSQTQERKTQESTRSEGIESCVTTSSRTSTHSASSLRSSVTIDSSIFFVSPESATTDNKIRSSLSQSSDLSTSEISSLMNASDPDSHHRRHSTNESCDSLNSYASVSSSSKFSSRSSSSGSSSRSRTESFETTTSTSGRSRTSSSSVSPSSSNSNSSNKESQETVSIESSDDDDNTLANTFSNVLVIEELDLENGDPDILTTM